MIRLIDFFKVPFPEKTKVKFNVNPVDSDTPALDLLLDDDPKWIEMNAYKPKGGTNFGNAEYVLTFAQYYYYGEEYYVFGGMYQIESIVPDNVYYVIGYKLTPIPDYSEYTKRLIVKLNKPIGIQNYNRKYISLQEQLSPEVYEIKRLEALEHFPGYGNVLINHTDLQRIARNEALEWKEALINVKGVYCITDKSTGQLYIGSASGDDEGIWQHWKSYADVNDLTGGNKTFERLKRRGDGHIIDNFTYSILEVFDMRTERDYVVSREEYYKRVFQSVKYGMNN